MAPVDPPRPARTVRDWRWSRLGGRARLAVVVVALVVVALVAVRPTPAPTAADLDASAAMACRVYVAGGRGPGPSPVTVASHVGDLYTVVGTDAAGLSYTCRVAHDAPAGTWRVLGVVPGA